MRLFIMFAVLLVSACATTQNFAERAVISKASADFPQFTSYDSVSKIEIDHGAFDQFLNEYLVPTTLDDPEFQGANLIRYGDVTNANRSLLADYVEGLEAVNVKALNREEQLAYWINLYNAATILTILDNYPVESIRDIKSSPFDFKGPWNDDRVTVDGTVLTLDDIENKIIRPIFDDPRIHYAVNCAAIGCPNLLDQAYEGKTLDQVLDQQARAFINNPRGVTLSDGSLTVSRIFLWYKEDYGTEDENILSHIRKFADPGLKNDLMSQTKIDAYAYDWDLNDGTNK